MWLSMNDMWKILWLFYACIASRTEMEDTREDLVEYVMASPRSDLSKMLRRAAWSYGVTDITSPRSVESGRFMVKRH